MFVVYKCLKWACKPVTNKNVDILGMMNDGGKIKYTGQVGENKHKDNKLSASL